MSKISLKDFLVRQVLVDSSIITSDFVVLPDMHDMYDINRFSKPSDYIISKKAKVRPIELTNILSQHELSVLGKPVPHKEQTVEVLLNKSLEENQISYIDHRGLLNTRFIMLSEFMAVRPQICLDAQKIINTPNMVKNLHISTQATHTKILPNRLHKYKGEARGGHLHVLSFGYYPQCIVEGKVAKELEAMYNNCDPRLVDLDKTTTNPRLSQIMFDKHYEYDGFTYVRSYNQSADKANRFSPDVYFSNGKVASVDKDEERTFLWFRVQPIEWVITNWEKLPKEINSQGRGVNNHINLVAKDAILANIPYTTSLVGPNNFLWQNSFARAYLNSYNIHSELATKNGTLEKIAPLNYDFSRKGGFLNEAFDYTIEREQGNEKGGKDLTNINKQTRLTKLSKQPDTKQQEMPRAMTTLEMVKTWINYGESVLLRGPSGIGKTSMLVNEYGDRLVRLKLYDNMFPEKVLGSTNLQTGEEIPPFFAKKLINACATEAERAQVKANIQNLYDVAQKVYERSKETDEKIVLLLDELLNVKPQVQTLVYSIVLEKLIEIGDGINLPKNTVIVATGNQQKFSSTSYELANPLEKRFNHILDVEPKVGEWLANYAIPHNLHPSVIGYIYYKYKEAAQSEEAKNIIYFYEDIDVGEKNLDKFGSRGKTNDPRNWEQVSHFLYKFESDLEKGVFNGLDATKFLLDSLSTMLRDVWVESFWAFYNEPCLTVEDVISANYTKDELPEDIGQRFAQVSMLLAANEEQVAVCREFIFHNCGPEYLRSFDVTWCANNPARAELVAELGYDFATKPEIAQGDAVQITMDIENDKISINNFFDALDDGKVLAIQCSDSEQAQTLTTAFRLAGKTWSDGTSYINDKYGAFNNSCYVNNGTIASFDECTKCGIDVIPFKSIILSPYIDNNKLITLDDFINSSDPIAIKCNPIQAMSLAQALDYAGAHTDKGSPFSSIVQPFGEHTFCNDGNWAVGSNCLCRDADSSAKKYYEYNCEDVDFSKYINLPYKMTIDEFWRLGSIGKYYEIKCSNLDQVNTLCVVFFQTNKHLAPTVDFMYEAEYTVIKDRIHANNFTNYGTFDYTYAQSTLKKPGTIPIDFEEIDFRKYLGPNRKINLKDWALSKERMAIQFSSFDDALFVHDVIESIGRNKPVDNTDQIIQTFITSIASRGLACCDNRGFFSNAMHFASLFYKVIKFEDVDSSMYRKLKLDEFFNSDNIAIHVNNKAQAKLLCKALNAYCKKYQLMQKYDENKIDTNCPTKALCFTNKGSLLPTLRNVDCTTSYTAPRRAFIDAGYDVYEFESIDFENYLSFLEDRKVRKLITYKVPKNERQMATKTTEKANSINLEKDIEQNKINKD